MTAESAATKGVAIDVPEQDTPSTDNVLVRIKFESYSNPTNKLANGWNCDLWGWSPCDPYFNIMYTSTHLNGQITDITTTHYQDKGAFDFLDILAPDYLNPITMRAPVGARIDVQIRGFDDDIKIKGEKIGDWTFSYVVGSPVKMKETKKADQGPATLTLSFY